MSNVFRKEYRVLSDAEKDAVHTIKDLAGEIYTAITENVPDARSSALARTKLEECVFWAVKGITG